MQSQSEHEDFVLNITNAAQDVFINIDGVEQLAMEVIAYMIRNYNDDNIDDVAFRRYVRLSSEFHPKRIDHYAVDWLFVLNTLNFGLWPRKNEQEWTVDGLTGYIALSAAIKRAIDEEKPIWDPEFYTTLSMSDMEHIFRGDDNNFIPHIHKRLKLLHSIGNILLENYKGTFVECIKLCECDALKLVKLLTTDFPSYKDEEKYDEKPVRLYCKAWILVNDIWSFYNPENELSIQMPSAKVPTMFADYRVTQVLNHFNALQYSENFLNKIKRDEVINKGSREELEIRCCSLMIIRHVHNLVKERCDDLTSDGSMPELELPNFNCNCLIDNFLWDYRQVHNAQLKKNVLCKTITDQY